MDSIHRYLLSYVRQRKYDVVNFKIQATGVSEQSLIQVLSWTLQCSNWNCGIQDERIFSNLTKNEVFQKESVYSFLGMSQNSFGLAFDDKLIMVKPK